MIDYPKNQADTGNTDPIDKIAACLSDNFVKPLFDFRHERKYLGYVKSLAEILNWSHEFYKQYHHAMTDWEAFKKSEDNIFNAANWNDFLIAWGHKRMRQFFAQNINDRDKPPKCMNGKNRNNGETRQNNLSVRIVT